MCGSDSLTKCELPFPKPHIALLDEHVHFKQSNLHEKQYVQPGILEWIIWTSMTLDSVVRLSVQFAVELTLEESLLATLKWLTYSNNQQKLHQDEGVCYIWLILLVLFALHAYINICNTRKYIHCLYFYCICTQLVLPHSFVKYTISLLISSWLA